MARTNAGAVQSILLDDYDVERAPSLQAAIRIAGLITTRVATCAAAKDKPLSADELVEVETLLAAHFYAISDKPYASNSTEGASASFHGQTGMYLEATLYGQHATLVDASGCLATIASGERKVAGGFWLGKAPSEQIDYHDRD